MVADADARRFRRATLFGPPRPVKSYAQILVIPVIRRLREVYEAVAELNPFDEFG